MDNLMFGLNATVPVFLLMLLGALFHKVGWIDDILATKLNRFVFLVPLPVVVFEDLATVSFDEMWDPVFVLYCFTATLTCILIAVGISFFWKDRSIRGEFVQASYRSSAALLGLAFIRNIYGNASFTPLMIIGSVPLYNAMAVIVLTLMKPDSKGLHAKDAKKVIVGILTNPILIGIWAGLFWSYFRLPFSGIFADTVSRIGQIATPLGLMAMGASFDFKKAIRVGRPTICAAFLKLIGFGMLCLPFAMMLGFRNERLVASIVMLGSATTVSSYVMARSMGHEGVLTGSTVMLTTLLSAFTLTLWLTLFRSFGYL